MKPVHEENWKIGDGSFVVSDSPLPAGIGINGADDPHYGGFLVAESIAEPYRKPIAAVPAMIRFIRRVAFEPIGHPEATHKEILIMVEQEAEALLESMK